jgi:hypothetical protein
MISLQYVLISIDYHSFYFKSAPQREFLYSYYFGINNRKRISENTVNSLLISGYGLKNGLLMLTKKPRETVKGWCGYSGTDYSKFNELAGKKRVERFDKLIHKNMSSKNKILESLDQFILFLKNKNINPVLVTLPCHGYFNKYLDKEIVRQNKIDALDICRKHNIFYLNFSNERLPDSCFYNIDHLNKEGAKRISKKINNYINFIGFIKNKRTRLKSLQNYLKTLFPALLAINF